MSQQRQLNDQSNSKLLTVNRGTGDHASTGVDVATQAQKYGLAAPKPEANDSVASHVKPWTITPQCLMCRKTSDGDMVCPCACASKFMHDACLVEHIIRNLDKPCQMCGHFYQCKQILKRAKLNVHTMPESTLHRNKTMFLAAFFSTTLAFLVLQLQNSKATNAYSFVCSHIGQVATVPIMSLLLSILVHNLVQYYLRQPTNVHYFMEKSRLVVMVDPAKRQQVMLYIRSFYGMLVNPTDGNARMLNKHVYDTTRKWRFHRLMAP